MTPAALVSACRAAGVQLSPRDGQIILRPAGALRPDLRAALVANKPDVLALLQAERTIGTGTGAPCPVRTALDQPSEGVCTIGKSTGDAAPCPVCTYSHGNLNDREPCSTCGREDWTVSLVDARGVGRTCAACVSDTVSQTPRTREAMKPGDAVRPAPPRPRARVVTPEAAS